MAEIIKNLLPYLSSQCVTLAVAELVIVDAFLKDFLPQLLDGHISMILMNICNHHPGPMYSYSNCFISRSSKPQFICDAVLLLFCSHSRALSAHSILETQGEVSSGQVVAFFDSLVWVIWWLVLTKT